jgi:L-fuculose-phosphate aldolase
VQTYIRKTYPSDFEARRAIIEIGQCMYTKNYVPAGSGSISVRVSSSEIWTSPAGIARDRLSHGNLIKLNMSGRAGYGKPQPLPGAGISAQLKIFAENPEINALIHAWPPAAVALAASGISPDKAPAELVPVFGPPPLVLKVRPEELASYCGSNRSVILAFHGAFAWGQDVFEALFGIEALEHYAAVLLNLAHVSSHEQERPEPTARSAPLTEVLPEPTARSAPLTEVLPESGFSAEALPFRRDVGAPLERLPIRAVTPSSSFPSLASQADGCGCGCIPVSCLRTAVSKDKTKDGIIEDVVQSVIARFAGGENGE